MRRGLLALARLAPDVVCLQFEAHAFELRAVPHFLPLALRLAHFRVVVTYHELWGPKWFRHAGKLALLNAPQRVVTPGEWHAAGVRRFRWRRPGPDVIPVGPTILPRTRLDRALQRSRFGIEKDEIVLTFFGFVVPEHGVDDAIVALRRLLDQGRRVHLSVIGPIDRMRNGYHQRLFALARELGVEKDITWHGRVKVPDDAELVVRLLAVADVGVLPFRSGIGENNTTFAAFAAAGLPTVTIAGPRSAAIEREGIAVFAAPGGESLAAAIAELVDDPPRGGDLGTRAQAWAQRRSWEQIARGYVEIFEKVVTDSGRGS